MIVSLSKTRAFLRCASCRFAALYFVPFAAGMALAGRASAAIVLFAAAFWIAHSLGIELTNRLSDRREDEVNRPERTALCAQVGWGSLRRAQGVVWAVVLAMDGLWLLLAGSLPFAAMLALSFAIGVGYSRGARISRVRYVGLLIFNLLFAGVFVMGWTVGDPLTRSPGDWHALLRCVPLLIVVGVFIVTLVGLKDVTDRLGDLRIGYRSPFVDALEAGDARLLRGLATLPFALIALFACLSLLPVRLTALFVFAPASALLVEAAQGARARADQLLVREIFYTYWLLFCSASLLLLRPSMTLALVVVGAVLYWQLTTVWLHWGEALRPGDLGRALRLARWIAPAQGSLASPSARGL